MLRDLQGVEDELGRLEVDNADRDLVVRDSAARLRAHAEDAVLLERLAEAGFSGPEYDRFVLELCRYGCAVIMAWLHTGQIYVRTHRIGRPVPSARRPRNLTDDDRTAIVDLAVVYGLRLFERVALRQRRWRDGAGASLKTFFIGACILTFDNALKAWKSEQAQRECPDQDIEFWTEHAPDPCEELIMAELERDLLELIGDEAHQQIVIRTRDGYTQRQIADLQGLTEKAVERRLDRVRKRVKKSFRRGGVQGGEENE